MPFNFDRFRSSLTMPLFRGVPTHAFGLAVADSSLELVNIVEHGSNLAIDFFNRVPLEEGVIMRGYIRKSDKFAAAVSELFKNVPVKESNRVVVSALPDYQVFTRLLTIPDAEYDKKTIHEEVQSEMSKSLPLEFSEVVMRTLERAVPRGSHEIMVFATHRSLVANWQSSFSKAGLTLAAVEMESLALTRSLIQECPLDAAYFTADLGGSSSDLSIADCYGINLSASIASGGKRLTEMIAAGMQIGTDEAEQQKRAIGLTGEGHSPVTLILEKELEPIAKKINEEIAYFERAGLKVIKIILAGGTSAMPGIVEYFTQKCGRPAERGHPWVSIQSEIVGSFTLSTKKLPQDQESFYAGATGLALRGLNRGKLKEGINFLE